MIKTPLSIAIGGVGFYTKNAVVIGSGHKSEPEQPFDPASLFENGEIGTLLDGRLNVDEEWRVNLVHSTTNPDLWLNAFTYTSMLNNAYQLTLTDEKSSGIGLGALSTYPAGKKIEANKTVYRSVEVKKVDAKYLRFGAAADGSAVFIDLDTLEVLRNAGNIQCLIERLSDDFIRISTFVYHSASPSATHASSLLGWGNVRLTASLSETLGTSLIVRKPVFALLDGYDLDTPRYQEIITADAAFLEAHPNHMLFQDAAATVPVLSKAQPVGLMLDKSENLIIGNNVSLVTSAFKDADSVKYIQILNDVALANRFFKIKFKINSIANERSIFFEGVSGGTVKYLIDLSTDFVIKSGATGAIRIGGLSAALFDFSDIEVREISGNHAYQTTSSARPLLQDNVQFDSIDNALNITFPSALTNCTIFSVKHGGQAQILEAQSVAQNHVINQDFKYYGIVNRTLTSAERAGLTRFLNKVGAQ